MQEYTLLFPTRNNRQEVLLGYKKTKINAGFYNGYGGKIEESEDLIQAALRETQEECGLELNSNEIIHHGHFDYIHLDRDPEYINRVQVFSSNDFSDNFHNSSEMDSQIFQVSDLPWNEIWASDRTWILPVLQNSNTQFYSKALYHNGKLVEQLVKFEN